MAEKPGEAIVQRDHETGKVTVLKADRLIWVTDELLRDCEPWVWRDGVLQLDTAGEYRYRRIAYRQVSALSIFERITDS